jgi:hypothetical protein
MMSYADTEPPPSIPWRASVRHEQERRRLLADDVRRLAGLADFAVGEAQILGAELPDEVARCVVSWRLWAGELARWSRGDEDTTDSTTA